MPQNVASDQGLHCLLTGISIRNGLKSNSTQDTPKSGSGFVQLINMDAPIMHTWVKSLPFFLSEFSFFSVVWWSPSCALLFLSTSYRSRPVGSQAVNSN